MRTIYRVAVTGRENRIVRLGRLADRLDAIKVGRDRMSRDERAKFCLPAHADTNELPSLPVRA